jgi:fructose transport system ATP-binding protein
MTAPVLEAKGLVKLFGRVVGLAGVDMTLYPGEVLAVIGDNGAGKSTLIKCLSGAMVPDEGGILVDGAEVHFRRPPDAQAAGIETVYQTLAVAPALDIASNLYLGREQRRKGVLGSVFRMLDTRGMNRHASEHIKTLGISTLQNIGQAVETLSGGQRQAVAVARAAAFGSKVVILDEPTAALGVRESEQVLRPARARARRHPDQPQHAAGLRGRRPHSHPAPRPVRRRRDAAQPQHAGRGGDHDRGEDGGCRRDRVAERFGPAGSRSGRHRPVDALIRCGRSRDR